MSERIFPKAGKAAVRPIGAARHGYATLGAAARDFRLQWRGRPRRAQHGDRVRDGLVAFYCLITVAMVAVLFDADAAAAARDLPRSVYRFFVFVTDFGKSGYLFFITGVACLAAAIAAGSVADKAIRAAMGLLAGRAAYVFAVLAVSGIASQALKRIGRARPKLLDEVGAFQFDPFRLSASWSSFPSGHTITAFAFAMALGYFLPRWRTPLLVFAALVAISRVVVGAHYPSDVVAGACIGIGTAILLRRAFATRSIVFSPSPGGNAVRGPGLILPALRKMLRARSSVK